MKAVLGSGEELGEEGGEEFCGGLCEKPGGRGPLTPESGSVSGGVTVGCGGRGLAGGGFAGFVMTEGFAGGETCGEDPEGSWPLTPEFGSISGGSGGNSCGAIGVDGNMTSARGKFCGFAFNP